MFLIIKYVLVRYVVKSLDNQCCKYTMAIYHFNGTVVSRSQGRSAIASAAYRSGEKLYDEKQERFMNYSRKQDVVFKEILLPADAPVWMADREKLWNAVERSETRKDAQLAREFNFALPKEFSKEQNISVAKEFVQNEFVARGMIADLCIHAGRSKNGQEQPHAHVMLTLREVGPNGFGLKNRTWNAKENLMHWRESWAEHLNHYLALNGIDKRVDHRSLANCGINLTPQVKIGSINLKDHERRLEEYQRIARVNGEKLLEDPFIVLSTITHHQSTFTRHDIARFINAHTADVTQFQAVSEKVFALNQLVSLGKDKNNHERYTTKEMLALEQKMLANVKDLQNSGHGLREIPVKLHESHLTSEQNNGTNLPSGNVSSEQSKSSQDFFSLQQKNALEHIIGPGDIKCIVGYAGTGKSHILKEAKEIWEKNGYRVSGLTLSGIAAENLEGASGITSRTFASRNYYWDQGREKLTAKDVLVIDEAGMLGTRQIAKAIDEVKSAGAKLVMIGDPQQLQAIEAGAAFRAITTKTSYLELTEVRRQQEIWQQEATKEFALRNVQAAIRHYDRRNLVHCLDNQDLAKSSLVGIWNEVRLSRPEKTQIMLAYTRKDATELNEIARDCKKQNNELGQDHKLETSVGDKHFAEGDRIYFLRNNRDLGVMNGTLGSIRLINNNRLTIALDKNEGVKREVNFDLNDYNYITHGYAATIHKAQGVTVDRSYILASKHLDSHAIYVGMSRHRESAELFWSKEEFRDEKELLRTLERDRSKDVALDYIQDPSREGLNETLAIENSFESRVDRIIKDCTRLVNSINHCNAKLQEFTKAGNDSPYLREAIAQSSQDLIQSLRVNGGRDRDILRHLEQYEPQLFNSINSVCNNILTNTIRELESTALLSDLTKGQTELYEKVLTAENKYKELNREDKEATDAIIKIFETGDRSDLTRYREVSDNAREALDQHANMLCKDTNVIRIISQHNPELFNEMNRNHNYIFLEALKKDDLQKEYINSMSPYNKAMTIDERVQTIYEQYRELSRDCTEALDNITKIYTETGGLASLRECREISDAAEKALDEYTSDVCRDKDFMNYLSENDKPTYKIMNERFNELSHHPSRKLHKEIEKIL